MISQSEADSLIAMRKTFVRETALSVPPGCDETHDLISDNKHEQFLFDIWRGTLRLSKLKLQTRGRTVIVLVRLDIDGAPHTNPDGEHIGGTHIHLYREGFEDKFAFPLDKSQFTEPGSLLTTIEEFCRFCSIDGFRVQGGLL